MDKLTLEKTDAKDDLQEELALYRVLKPYIGHCLTLNHDINNHLAGVIGYAEFLMEETDGLEENQKEYLNQILICAMRIKKLVEDLCEEKVALTEKVDLKQVTDAYQKIAKPLDQ